MPTTTQGQQQQQKSHGRAENISNNRDSNIVIGVGGRGGGLNRQGVKIIILKGEKKPSKTF
jgi:hypothetical protein